MLRKPLVNDVVRSFVYCIRNRKLGDKLILDFPFPVMGEYRATPYVESKYTERYGPAALINFALFAYYFAWTRGHAESYLRALSDWFGSFSPAERRYAIYLLDTYYMKDIPYVRT